MRICASWLTLPSTFRYQRLMSYFALWLTFSNPPAVAQSAQTIKHTLSVLVEDEAGVLTRIAGLFARRGVQH